MVSVSTKRELNYVRVSSSSSSWFSAFLGRFVRLMAPFATMSSSLLQLAVIVFYHPVHVTSFSYKRFRLYKIVGHCTRRLTPPLGGMHSIIMIIIIIFVFQISGCQTAP